MEESKGYENKVEVSFTANKNGIDICNASGNIAFRFSYFAGIDGFGIFFY